MGVGAYGARPARSLDRSVKYGEDCAMPTRIAVDELQALLVGHTAKAPVTARATTSPVAVPSTDA
jgi:hypothetical protein